MSGGLESAPVGSWELIAKFASQLSNYWKLKNQPSWENLHHRNGKRQTLLIRAFVFGKRVNCGLTLRPVLTEEYLETKSIYFSNTFFWKAKKLLQGLQKILPPPLPWPDVSCAHVSTKDWQMGKVKTTPVKHIGFLIPENQDSLS